MSHKTEKADARILDLDLPVAEVSDDKVDIDFQLLVEGRISKTDAIKLKNHGGNNYNW